MKRKNSLPAETVLFCILILLCEESEECFVCAVDIYLADYLVRCVHREYRHTHIDGVHIHIGDIHSDCSAAASVNLAQLTGLPENMVLVQKSAYPSAVFGTCVRGVALSSCSGELSHAHALVDERSIILFVSKRPGWVISRINIGRETF